MSLPGFLQSHMAFDPAILNLVEVLVMIMTPLHVCLVSTFHVTTLLGVVRCENEQDVFCSFAQPCWADRLTV